MIDIRHNSEVVFTISTMDLKLKYQNSKLGFLWSFIKPLMQFCTYYVVFGVILHYSDSPDYPLRMFLGILLWVLFTEGTSMGLASYIGKKSIITKIKVQKELLPISAYFTAAISYLLNMSIFLAMYHIFYADFIRIYSLKNLIVLAISFITLSITIISVNIFLANINALFRDIQTIWEIILMYGCFLTPIMYTLPIPERFMPLYLFINPLVMPIECFRSVFFQTDVYYWQNTAYLLAYLGSLLFWALMAVLAIHKLSGRVTDYL